MRSVKTSVRFAKERHNSMRRANH